MKYNRELNINALISAFYFLLQKSQYWKSLHHWVMILNSVIACNVQSLSRIDDSNLTNVTSIGEIVIARTYVTVLPRLRNAEARWVAGGWGIIQLRIQRFVTC